MASPTPTSVPPNVASIVPGSIFQDDLPPILPDPSTGDPSQYSPPAGVGSSGGGGTPQIEVNSTIQTVLIALGIVIGVLVLIAIVATYYISHKNRSAEEQKEKEKEQEKENEKELPSSSDVEGEGDLKTVVVMTNDSEKQKQSTAPEGHLSSDSFISRNGLLTEGNGGSASEDDGAGSGVGRGFSRPHNLGRETAAFASSIGSSVHSYPTTTGGSNPRNSIAHVTQTYAQRQSALVTPVAGASHSMGGVEVVRTSMSVTQESALDRHSNPFYGNGNTSATVSTPALGQLTSPPPSVGSNSPSMVLLDPFKTNNNSTSSLNILTAAGSTTTDGNERGLNTNIDESPAASKDWSKAQEYLRHRKSEDSYNPRVILRQSLKTSPSPTASTNRYTVNILSEPIMLLHSNTASTTSVTSGSSGALPVEISYQPPLTPTSPIVGFDRYASRRAVDSVTGNAASRSNEDFLRPSARNGAAVFEGATLQRNNKPFGGDRYGDDGQEMSDVDGERRGRQSLDFNERMIVSLPIIQSGLLSDDDDRGNDDELIPSRVFKHRHQPSNGTASGMPYMLETQGELSRQYQTIGQTDPTAASRASKDKKGDSGGGGKSSYLDDYREQQKLRKLQQQQQREGAAGTEGRISTTGRRRSSKFIQNAFHRASQLYASSSATSSSSSSARDPRGNGQPATAKVEA